MINEVILCPAWLVLGCATAHRYTVFVCGQLPRLTQPGYPYVSRQKSGDGCGHCQGSISSNSEFCTTVGQDSWQGAQCLSQLAQLNLNCPQLLNGPHGRSSMLRTSVYSCEIFFTVLYFNGVTSTRAKFLSVLHLCLCHRPGLCKCCMLHFTRKCAALCSSKYY